VEASYGQISPSKVAMEACLRPLHSGAAVVQQVCAVSFSWAQ